MHPFEDKLVSGSKDGYLKVWSLKGLLNTANNDNHISSNNNNNNNNSSASNTTAINDNNDGNNKVLQIHKADFSCRVALGHVRATDEEVEEEEDEQQNQNQQEVLNKAETVVASGMTT